MRNLFLIHGQRYNSLDWLNKILNSIPQMECIVDQNNSLTPREQLHSNLAALEGTSTGCSGRISYLSIFDAHHWALADRTKTSYVRANVLKDPLPLVTDQAKKYLHNTGDQKTLKAFLAECEELREYRDLRSYAKNRLKLDAANPEIACYLRALTDLADVKNDFSVPAEHWKAELLATPEGLTKFVKKLTRSQMELSLEQAENLLRTADLPKEINFDPETIEKWKLNLLAKRLGDLEISSFYRQAGYRLDYLPSGLTHSGNRPDPLVSIQLNSNRPAQFSWFLDALEQTADSTKSFEVLVHIDEGDFQMEESVLAEIKNRPFTLKYVKSDIVKNFGDLWKPLNLLYPKTDPNAYFLLNLADEMLIKTRGWDTILRGYVGFYPDHIFRLRASQFRFRNYTDLWECGYAPDSLTFYTKKWLEVGNEWNPCLGPDSFQQCVAYHLNHSDKHSHSQTNRDVPLPNINFDGEGASIGLSAGMARERQKIHYKAWFTLMSHEIQEEAARRAMKIKAQTLNEKNLQGAGEIVENLKNRRIDVTDPSSGQVVYSLSYRQSKLRYFVRNLYRRHNYYYYCGGGKHARLERRVGRLAIRFFQMLRRGPKHSFRAITRRIPFSLKPASE